MSSHQAVWLRLLSITLISAAPALASGSNAPLPIDQVAPRYRDRVRKLLEKPVLRHKSPAEVFACQPVLYQWLIEHPCWVNALWQQVGLPVCRIKEIDDGYEIAEPASEMRARFNVVYESAELRIIYGEGQAKHPLIPVTVRGEIVLVHRFQFSRQNDGRYFVAQQIEAFLRVDSVSLKAIMKLAKGTTERLTEQAIGDLQGYFSIMCQMLQARPPWSVALVGKVADKLPNDQAKQITDILRQLPVSAAAVRSARGASQAIRK